MGRAEKKTLSGIVKPGMTVLDIGSNLGLYTILISKMVGEEGRVIAFEPDKRLFKHLQNNCLRNNCINVDCYNNAVGSRTEIVELNVSTFNSGDNYVGSNKGDSFRVVQTCKSVDLDSFLPVLRFDILKIDIQGYEVEAMKGMQNVLEKNPNAIIYFELFPAGLKRAGFSAYIFTNWFISRGFKISKINSNETFTPQSLDILISELSGNKYINLIAHK